MFSKLKTMFFCGDNGESDCSDSEIFEKRGEYISNEKISSQTFVRTKKFNEKEHLRDTFTTCTNILFYEDDNLIIIGTSDGNVFFGNSETGKIEKTLKCNFTYIIHMIKWDDNKTFLSTSMDGKIVETDIQKMEVKRQVKNDAYSRMLKISPHEFVVVNDEQQVLEVLRYSDGKLITYLRTDDFLDREFQPIYGRMHLLLSKKNNEEEERFFVSSETKDIFCFGIKVVQIKRFDSPTRNIEKLILEKQFSIYESNWDVLCLNSFVDRTTDKEMLIAGGDRGIFFYDTTLPSESEPVDSISIRSKHHTATCSVVFELRDTLFSILGDSYGHLYLIDLDNYLGVGYEKVQTFGVEDLVVLMDGRNVRVIACGNQDLNEFYVNLQGYEEKDVDSALRIKFLQEKFSESLSSSSSKKKSEEIEYFEMFEINIGHNFKKLICCRAFLS